MLALSVAMGSFGQLASLSYHVCVAGMLCSSKGVVWSTDISFLPCVCVCMSLATSDVHRWPKCQEGITNSKGVCDSCSGLECELCIYRELPSSLGKEYEWVRCGRPADRVGTPRVVLHAPCVCQTLSLRGLPLMLFSVCPACFVLFVWLSPNRTSAARAFTTKPIRTPRASAGCVLTAKECCY